MLEGKRLMNVNSVSGGYGGAGAEYRAQIDTWIKVVAAGQAGSGPESFTVTLKNGFTAEFGGTADSRELATGSAFASGSKKGSVQRWFVSKVTDLNGNWMEFHYTDQPRTATGSAITSASGKGRIYPSEVAYTLHKGQDAQRFVRFCYEERPDNTPQYEGGSLQQTTVRLTNVQTWLTDSAGTTNMVREYRVAYDGNAPMNASRIASVTEYSGNGNPLTPTTFSWSNAPDGFQSGNTNYGGPGNNAGWVTVIQASGGYHVDTSGYSSNPHHVTTKGEATYIMPTGHTIVIHWKVVWGQSPEVTMGGTYPRIPAPTKEETSTNHWHYTWELS